MKYLNKVHVVMAALVMALLMANACPAEILASTVTIVSHVDIIPSAFKCGSEESAARLLRAQALATQRDAGLVSYAIYQQDGGSNHFTVVETWRDARSYELHQGAGHTVQFRNDLQQFLGSPFDTREHHLFR